MKTLQFIKISQPTPGVALVELARKPVNAFSVAYWTELGEVFDNICFPDEAENDVKVVVLASALPKIFSAGVDLMDIQTPDTFANPDPGRRMLYARHSLTAFQSAISALERCPVPVIAAIHGLAYGLAMDILSAADVRYASEDVRFSIKEVDVGLAADIGTLARIQKATGNSSFVHELAYTSRDFTAAEALSFGYVSRVIPQKGKDAVLAAALELAGSIATKSPIAIVGTKRLLLHARDHSVAENLEYTALWNGAMLQSPDFGDSIRSFETKKAPVFRNLPALNGIPKMKPKPKL